VQHRETVVESAWRPAAGPIAADFSLGRFLLVLAAGVFAAFPQVLAGLETFVIRDFGFFAYPLAHFQRECFWRGELPMWNPYNHCGVPFLAQWNTMALYPPALIYLLLPLPWSLNLFCLLHCVWAGTGMYLLGRRWTGSGLGAAAAGLGFAFNGFALNLLMWPSHIATYSWMPWVVLTVEAGWERGGRNLVWGAIVGALQMLAGGPETILFTWVVLTVLWLARIFRPSAGESARRGVAWRFPAMVVLVASLAAAQLLPFLDLASHSQREQGFADARWSMPSWGWMNLFVPMVFGTSGKQGLFFQYDQYWTSSYYPGVAVLMLALVACKLGRGGRFWILAGAAAVGLALATGDQTGISRWARQVVPQLSLMTYPIKYVTLLIFVAPLLAAFGLAGLESRNRRTDSGRTLWIATGLVLAVVAAIIMYAWRFPFSTDDVRATVFNGLGRMGALLAAAFFLWLVLRSRAGLGPLNPAPVHVLAPLLFLGVLWADIRTHEPQQNPTVPGWVYTAGMARLKLGMDPQPELGKTRVMVSPAAETEFREMVMNSPQDNFLVKRLGYFANCNLLDAVPSVNGFYSLTPRETGELNSLLYVSGYNFGAGLPDFLSVSQITSEEDHTAWKARGTFLPVVTAGQAPVFLNDTNALGVLLSTNFNGADVVLLPPEARDWVTVSNRAGAQVTQARVESTRVEVEVEADQPCMVVLSQTYYHPWRARVDGRSERLLRANFAFQALQVPAGKHRVTLAYEDKAFRLGVGISAAGLAACCLALLKGRRRSTGLTGSGI
jgi:hypothetical protein